MKDRNVLLLAMSGVRAVNPELIELGLTLPGFLDRGKVIASLPSLSLLTLAAHTPPGWEARYEEMDAVSEERIEEIVAEGHDLVAISALTARIRDAYHVADRLREAGVRVAMGGLHVTACPEEAMRHADVVVQGEGEAAWPAVLEGLANGSPAPRYNSLNGGPKFDFSRSRTPRYDLLDPDDYNRLTVQATRGCPRDCTFCAASRLISPYRIKPLHCIRREIEAVLEIWPRPFVELADDNTFLSHPWSRKLAALMADYPVRWFTETDISVADDDELLDLLAVSGCAQLLIGFESVNGDSLGEVDDGWKRKRAERYLQGIEKIQSHGISVNGCFVLGFDEDGPGIFESTARFVRESGLSEVQITVLTPFPGTELHRRLEREGRLLPDATWDQCTLFDVTYRPARMSVTDLETGFRGLMADLYSHEESARRARIRKSIHRKRTGTGSGLSSRI